MPEALAVLVVFVVTLVAWAGAWMHARDPANTNAREEVERLRHHAAWLEQRIDVAQREKWDGEMIDNLSAELAATTQQLAQTRMNANAR
jgi:hypothetical protein